MSKTNKTDLKLLNRQLSLQSESWVQKGYVGEMRIDEGVNSFRGIANAKRGKFKRRQK